MIFITGGERSGKSDFAIKIAMKKAKRAFLATGEGFDDEMRSRIERHKRERGDLFDTFEEAIEIDKTLALTKNYDVCVIDCMTTWLGNLIFHNANVEERIGKFLSALNGNEIVISNEVGMGIIPAEKMTRHYVETLGRLNQNIARVADEVYLMIAGIPLKVK
ncbi:MAG: bifunctional adenosylcobinamide kinase/adenosylcobinamide-phosphate guanylyltransferase [Mesoaciditoga sp.]|uniref:bifunctional adenosylcobinamide kinase/adenosylcobinamide-phosphate guanylyltransferase n=1 Tax=Athalassotoga sp. TaxID=2022597 RepID=UPI000CA9762D|nr:MAG: bifunctional adenosylcobinamide kinase/adenosylcobinamide-phosphate guanylyltransferase [Mesoaciditoga sp.]PMP80294.1 MAG: bifunctional adenosylcobinamide kinase/adenosylcobinamide-phosphate guanylyltransferase [Mesoaciditoga sp.]HEU23636.1 bifunctional adenosylcobinamide kinase/adenosylcobinamide-phosphate guanylyltransferase [Mesoaciditoga lauensis]